VVLKVILKMSSKRISVNPLALFLKPQSPAERLAAQHRDREKLQRERQLKGLQEEEAKARGEAGKRPVGRPRSSKNKLPSLTVPSGASIKLM
jgi:hypothetical protein